MDLYNIFCVLYFVSVGFVRPENTVPSLSMDQLITNAAQTSTAFDFIQDDNTLLVELDIKYTKDEWKYIEEHGLAKTEKQRRRALSRIKRKGVHGNRWTDATVPYIIADYFDDNDRVQIMQAIANYHLHTCVKFRPATTEANRIKFMDGGGCSSFIGMKGGEQDITLGRACRQHGIITHELGHALGFHHEQTRPDRDNYVTVLSENIPPNVYFNFQKFTNAVIKDWNIEYDYSSIMHYGGTAFSYNGKTTIVAKDQKYQSVMGNRDGFSFRDIKLMNIMYSCADHCTKKPKCPGEAFVGKDCRCWCPGQPVKICAKGDTGLMDGGSSSGSSPTSAPASTKKVCTDKKDNCEYWRQQGHCTSPNWSSYMADHCPKSCNVCPTEATSQAGAECADVRAHLDCDLWKQRGYCSYDSYKNFMRQNCRKTCAMCEEQSEINCKDKKTKCAAWAQRGYCSNSYVAYMRTNCPNSCKMCSHEAQTCTDSHKSCYSWAYKGECQKNPEWMASNCKKSCNTCEHDANNPVSDCVDMNTNCPEWAANNECSKNPSYMRNFCKKSCKRCGMVGDYSGLLRCKDSNQFCADWARRGECKLNPLYMLESCKKSCGTCTEGSGLQVTTPPQKQATCLDRDSNCPSWALNGECNANPSWMLPNCPLSCRQC